MLSDVEGLIENGARQSEGRIDIGGVAGGFLSRAVTPHGPLSKFFI